jgi:hypothetical protein
MNQTNVEDIMDRPACGWCRYFVPYPNPDKGKCFGHSVRATGSCRQFKPRREAAIPAPAMGERRAC